MRQYYRQPQVKVMLSTQKILSVSLFFGLTAPALSADQYDVELLIFSHAVVYSGGEQWREEAIQPAPRLTTLGVNEAETGFHPLPSTSWQLKGSDGRLRNSSQYNLLWHTRWRQPANTAANATAVNIYSDGAIESGALSGWAEFHVGRYPHLALDLVLQPPAKETFSPVDSHYNFHLSETRRLKNGEIHYYDHPAFGALAIVRPVKPVIKTTPTPTESTPEITEPGPTGSP